MGEPERPRATYQDVLDAPKHMIAEIFDGELVLSPRPAGPHASVTATVLTQLMSRFGRGAGSGWIVLIEPELHLGDHVVVPDIAGWRRARMDRVDDVPFFTLAPDWVCETLSRSTEARDRRDKLTIYAAHGVGHVWFVNPMRRTLEVFGRGDRDWRMLGVHIHEDVVRVEPFAEIEIDLATWWADLRTRPPGGRASEPVERYGVDL
jgi:Uma2 family endonuclease